MLEWKLIKKHPPPKDGRYIALCNPKESQGGVIATWIGGEHFNRKSFSGFPHRDVFTHWAEIGPLPTMEPGHE